MRFLLLCLFVLVLPACGDVSLREMQAATERALETQAGSALQGFYAEREYAPLWTQRDQLRDAGDTLFAHLCHAPDDLLDADAYEIVRLGTLHREAYARRAPSDSARAELLAALETGLSNAFLAYAYDRRVGAARPNTFPAPPPDTTALLGWPSLNVLRTTLDAPQDGYVPLHQAYRRYRVLADSSTWPSFSQSLQPGAPTAAVQRLRQHLAATGDLAAADGSDYDEALLEAVRQFQLRHGLLRTGLVDEPTRAALNVPASVRAQQLAASLERRRWLPASHDTPYLLVNLADQRVYGFRGGQERMRSGMTLGSDCRASAPFADSVATVVFAPGALRMPLVGTTAAYLSGGAGPSETGCFRVADALALATFALNGTGAWDDAEVSKALAASSGQTVALAAPLPVFVMPLTAWVDAEGRVHFRTPVSADGRLVRALRPARPQRLATACTAFLP